MKGLMRIRLRQALFYPYLVLTIASLGILGWLLHNLIMATFVDLAHERSQKVLTTFRSSLEERRAVRQIYAALIAEQPGLAEALQSADAISAQKILAPLKPRLTLSDVRLFTTADTQLASLSSPTDLGEDWGLSLPVWKALQGETNSHFVVSERGAIITAAAPVRLPGHEVTGAITISTDLRMEDLTLLKEQEQVELVIFHQDRPLLSTLRLADLTAILRQGEGALHASSNTQVTLSGAPYVAAWDQFEGGRILVLVPTGDLTGAQETATRWVIVVVAITGLLLTITAWAVARSLGTPLKNVSEVADALSKGDYSQRVPQVYVRELHDLGVAVNHLAGALQDAMAKLQRRAQELVDANRLKSQFLATMSHELRTPMNAIVGYTRVILDGLDGPINDDQREDLTLIAQSANRLLALINDILDLSKIEAGRMNLHPEVVPVSALLDEVVAHLRTLANQKGLQVQVQVQPELPSMLADPQRIRQVVTNLLSNAIKFTDTGSITISADCEDGWVSIGVHDTGCGIPEDARAFIFDEFRQVDGTSTRKQGGTGLGLAICRRLVEMHGGKLRVLSVVGAGSSFCFTVPAAPSPVRLPENAGAQAAAASQESGPDTSVLVIDDDPHTVELMARYLEPAGFRVLRSSGGEEGLKMAQEERPGVIILDLLMPGMNGWTVLSHLKSNPAVSQIPVVVASIIDNKQLGYSLGAIDYLVKPVARDDLISKLRKVTGGGGHILVVDDSAPDRELMVRLLEGQGYRVTQVESGQQALSMVADNRPNALVLDLMMPEMSGFEVIEHLRSTGHVPGLPIFVVTAKDLTAAETAYLRDHASRFFEKATFDDRSLIEEVQRAIRNGAGGEAS